MKKAERIGLIMVLAAIAVAVGAFLFHQKDVKRREAEQARQEAVWQTFPGIVENKLAGYFDRDFLQNEFLSEACHQLKVLDVECHGEVTFGRTDNPGSDYYEWNDRISVYVTIDPAWNALTEKEILKALEKGGKAVKLAADELGKAELAEYRSLAHNDLDREIYDSGVFFSRDIEFYVKAGEDLYEWCPNVEYLGYFVRNGQDVLVREYDITPPEATGPIVRRKDEVDSGSGSSGGKGKYGKQIFQTDGKDDPYDVYDYREPEDFYEDNYDEFEDYEDAEDYYDEAWEDYE